MATLNTNRLSFARKRRKLTKKELAERAGVSQVTLTRIDKGDTTAPTEETVSALASALDYPVSFFYQDDVEELQTTQVSFRSLSTMTAKQRDAALASGALGFLFNSWVSGKFNLPTPDLPELRAEDPETAAAAIRRHWGIGFKPIPHLIKLLEAKGVRVFTLSEGKDVDAFSFWKDGVPFIFLNTLKSAERSRFDAAHELGHLLLHVHGHTEGREVEREADQFASHFLMPREDVISSIPKISSLTQLIAAKSRWGVSLAALARTAYDASLISDWTYREFCKQMGELGYRTNEPVSRPRESSVLWKKILEELWKERFTKEKIAAALNLPQDEIESLLRGVLGADEPVDRERTTPTLRVV